MKKQKITGGKKPPVSLSVQRAKKKLQKEKIPLPRFKDENGKLRKSTSKELKDYEKQFKQAQKFYGTKFNKKDWGKTISYNLDLDKSAKKKRENVSEKRKKSLKPTLKRKEGYKYVQHKSISNFALGETENFGAKVYIKRKGRYTLIDTPEMFLKLQKATKQAQNNYSKALREKSKKTGVKISDMFFYATYQDGNNTIIDIDAIEYTGLTENEIKQAKLR